MNKINLTNAAAGLWLSIVLLFSCSSEKVNYLTFTSTAEEIRTKPAKIDKLFAMLTGHFSNKEQASKTDIPIYREQEIISTPIWRKRSGEYWFSMGWFQADFIEKPLSIGIFELKKYSRDTFQLLFYDIPNEEQYYTEWQKETPFSKLEPKELLHQSSCEYFVVWRNEDQFEVLQSGNPCKKHFMGPMQYFDFAAVLSPDGQSHYHSFFDENKVLIMTYPRSEGLNYKRLDKKNPKYKF